ncbi:MAG: sensor histidine kinase [Desulfonatronovibrionaceae bacterium]
MEAKIRISSEFKLLFHFALVFFLCLLLLDIAFLVIDYQMSLMVWDSWADKAGVMLFNILLWELILVTALTYLFLQLLRRYKRYKERTREYQELLLQTVSHKLGNFLAAQRVDFELLRDTGSKKALQRLEQGRSFLERDFRNMLRIIKDSGSEEPEPEKTNLSGLVSGVLGDFKEELEPEKTLLNPAETKCIRSEMEAVLYILFENAARYSSSKVLVRSGRSRGRPYVWIRNDIDPERVHGTGVGLNTARRLAKRNGFIFKWVKRDNFFLAALIRTAKKFRFHD